MRPCCSRISFLVLRHKKFSPIWNTVVLSGRSASSFGTRKAACPPPSTTKKAPGGKSCSGRSAGNNSKKFKPFKTFKLLKSLKSRLSDLRSFEPPATEYFKILLGKQCDGARFS